MSGSVDFLEQRVKKMFLPLSNEKRLLKFIQQAKEMENTERLKNTLFVGKVVEEIGFERTQELLIEVKNAFK